MLGREIINAREGTTNASEVISNARDGDRYLMPYFTILGCGNK